MPCWILKADGFNDLVFDKWEDLLDHLCGIENPLMYSFSVDVGMLFGFKAIDADIRG